MISIRCISFAVFAMCVQSVVMVDAAPPSPPVWSDYTLNAADAVTGDSALRFGRAGSWLVNQNADPYQHELYEQPFKDTPSYQPNPAKIGSDKELVDYSLGTNLYSRSGESWGKQDIVAPHLRFAARVAFFAIKLDGPDKDPANLIVDETPGSELPKDVFYQIRLGDTPATVAPSPTGVFLSTRMKANFGSNRTNYNVFATLKTRIHADTGQTVDESAISVPETGGQPTRNFYQDQVVSDGPLGITGARRARPQADAPDKPILEIMFDDAEYNKRIAARARVGAQNLTSLMFLTSSGSPLGPSTYFLSDSWKFK